MHRLVNCPSCDEEIRVPKEFLGKSMRCTFCGAPLFSAARQPAPGRGGQGPPAGAAPPVGAAAERNGAAGVTQGEEDIPFVKPVRASRRPRALLGTDGAEQPSYLIMLALLPLGLLLVLPGVSALAGIDLGWPTIVGVGLGLGLALLTFIGAGITALPVWARVLMSLAVTGLGYVGGRLARHLGDHGQYH